jgi:diguanylate cyclase (GGDEF)-like protein
LFLHPGAIADRMACSMGLDLHTLFLVTVHVEAMLGLLLLFAWIQNSAIAAVAWWGWAHLLRSASIALFGMYGSAHQLITVDLANALLFLSFAVTWTGARVFGGRAPSPIGLLAGVAVWLAASRMPPIADSMNARVLLSCVIIAAYLWLASYEFWRGRAEPLVSRWPAIFMLFAYGALFPLGRPLSLMLPWGPETQYFESVWMTVMSFESLLFTIAVAFIFLAMAKERAEFLHKTASLVDPLTGIANRRAFLEGSEEAARRLENDPRPASVLLIDLDHFKSINDNFGHAVGDRVLQVFAETASAHVDRDDLVGRLGGEEFAVLLCDTDRDEALIVAEEIRHSFARNASDVDGRPVSATASIGVATSENGKLDIGALLGQADQALYQAKELGRNRVESASLDLLLRLDSSTPSLRIPELAARNAA